MRDERRHDDGAELLLAGDGAEERRVARVVAEDDGLARGHDALDERAGEREHRALERAAGTRGGDALARAGTARARDEGRAPADVRHRGAAEEAEQLAGVGGAGHRARELAQLLVL